MSNFNSYQLPLRDVLREIGGQTPAPLILEYGPGTSTRIMKEILPAARIVTIEHQRKWYAHYRQVFSAPQFAGVELHHVKLNAGYTQFPLKTLGAGTADLIFIDGRRRVACLQQARMLLKPGKGIVLLHDAHRLRYRSGWSLWPASLRIWAGKPWDRTLILLPDASWIGRLNKG